MSVQTSDSDKARIKTVARFSRGVMAAWLVLMIALLATAWGWYVADREIARNTVNLNQPLIVLIGGVFTSFLLFGIAWSLTTTQTRAIALVRSMTGELRLKDRVIAAVGNGIIITDPNQPGNPVIYVNPAFERITGYSSQEVCGRNCRFLQGSETKQPELEEVRRALLEERNCRVVVKNYRKDGAPFWNEFSIWPVRNQQGQLTHFVGIQEDVSERRAALIRLNESEMRFRSVTESANEAIITANSRGRLVYWNRSVQAMFGYSEEEALGQSLEILMPERYRRSYQEALQRFVLTGEKHVIGKTLELHGLRKDGVEFPIELSVSTWETREERFFSGIIRDISRRRKEEEDLRKLSSAVAQTADRVVITDYEGVIEYVNPAAEHLTGYSPQEIIGKTPAVFKSGKHDQAFYAELWQIIKGGRVFRGEFVNRKKNGEFWYDDAVITPIRDNEGRISHYVLTGRDITERKRIENELKAARSAAEKANRTKSEFLANMSHEIRTPMNAVVGMTDLLLDTSLTAKQRDFVETIRDSGETLITIINEILDFSKVEAGMLKIEVADFDLCSPVESAVDLLAGKACSKGIELAMLINEDVPTRLRGDSDRLWQILTNLLNNAIKFTERGEVVVRVMKLRETPGDVTLRFAVSDTGIGILEEDQQRLFQAFSQIDYSITRKFGGTGLGLAICKKLVELMGGEIGVDSRTGKGSTFWFTMRLEKQPPLETAGEPGETVNPLAGRRVLVVDENEINREILQHHLETFGMQSTAVTKTDEALALLLRQTTAEKTFQLALINLQIPSLDGLKLVQLLKSGGRISMPRIVLMVPVTYRHDPNELRRMGVAVSLTKPVKRSQLLKCLTSVMIDKTRIAAGEGKAAPTLQSVDAHAHPSITRLCRARVLLVEDNLVNRKVALNQLQKLGCQVDSALNGIEALEAVSKVSYDIVLMDCQMPVMDGYTATVEIRRREGGARHTPIVAMTAHALKGDREKCLIAGMDDYVSKPVRTEKLREILERWCSATFHQGDEVPPPSAQKDSPAPVDMEFMRENTDGTPEGLQALIDLYLSQVQGHFPKLEAAVRNRAATEVRDIAHKMAGSNATCGVAHLAKLFRDLENLGIENKMEDAMALYGQIEKEFDCVRSFLLRYTP